MKNFLVIYFLWLFLLFNIFGSSFSNTYFQINQYDLNKTFKKMKCGLYINKKGDIGLLVFDKTNKSKRTRFLTYVYNADTLNSLDGGLSEFKNVVDTLTFQFLSEIYFKDQNHIYVFNPMADGGTIEINWNIDVNTFKILGKGFYAFDNKGVYYRGRVVEDANKSNFKVFTSNNLIHYAFDNINYFSGNERMSLSEVKRLGLQKFKN